MIHGGSSLDEEERVYAVEILRLGGLDSKDEETKLVTTP